jgi:flagellar biosynthesis protein FlhF
MKIKKFKAKTFTEALALVKKEFSEDAVILSTEERKGIRSFVEITAAVDYEMNNKKVENTIDRRNRKREHKRVLQKPGATAGNNGHPVSPGVCAPRLLSKELQYLKNTLTDEIQHGIENLYRMIALVKHDDRKMSLPAHKKMMLHSLMGLSMKEEFALRLCENAGNIDDIPSLLSADIKIRERNVFNGVSSNSRDYQEYKQAVMLIGPTGVGKTTTMAKLSAHAIEDGKKVAMMSLDTYRIGAVEQVRIYSKIMGIPFAMSANVRELKKNLIQFAQSRDIIFIDTSGRNPKDEMHINDLLEISKIEFPLETHLLMSANYDDEFITEAYRQYSRLPIDCIAFTKVDEAVRFGSLYNLLLTCQKPISYITTGQKVPNDIEFVTINKLTNLILKKGHCEC